MKTNQIMIRPMGMFSVEQRTKDGFFNGAGLLLQWNSIKENPRRRLSEFLESAKARLKMNDLRMTRIIGSPTDKVNLIFAALSDEQINALKGLAKKHGQVLSECGS